MVPGKADVSLEPRLKKTGLRGVVFIHSGGADGTSIINGTGLPGLASLMKRVGEEFLVAATNYEPQAFGNPTAQTRLGQCRTWLQANGALPGTVLCITTSQGAACALNYASDNPTHIGGIVSFMPGFHLDDLRDNDRGGTRVLIDAAWGVSYPAPLPAGANPALKSAQLSAIPQQMWYATDDPYIPTTVVTDWAAASGAEAYSVGALGHSDNAIAAAPHETVLEFLRANS